MDTKLKNSKGLKCIVTFIVAIVLGLTSLGLVSSYPLIEKVAKETRSNPFEDMQFAVWLDQSSIAIYSNLVNTREKKEVNPSEYLIDLSDADKEFIPELKNQFDESVKEYKRSLTYDLRNLEYYAVDTVSNSTVKYSTSNIEALISGNVDKNILKTLQDKYSFYAVVDFDPQGRMSVTSSYGASRETLDSRMHSQSFQGQNDGIVSTKMVFAVPRELPYTDSISGYVNSTSDYNYYNISRNFYAVALIFVFVFAMVFPYRKAKEVLGFNSLSKIPFEIHFIAASILLMLNTQVYTVIKHTIEGDVTLIANTYFSGYSRFITIILNIGYWFIIFYIAFLYFIYIKHVFNTGVIKYIKENSLIYKFIVPIKRNIKSVIKYIGEIDLGDKNTKKIVMALGINFLIILAICSVWFFGFFLSIIYTAVLYVLARRYLDKIRGNYKNLQDAINKIAEGNLDVKVNEDLGIFASFKEKIESIQKGFKKAVDEEVKSQKMKTELISNVSHDLKTPLTSIITYVDLLKDKDLPESKREEYLEILDKKSQRLQYLIEDLFEVSKATSGNVSLNIVDVDVVSLMKQTLLELDDKIEASSLIIRTSFSEGKVILALDSQRMFRVFENLIVNITKYAMEGSRVYINIEDSSEEVKIVLRNIAKDEIDFKADEVMERFTRGDKSRNTEGSGLGLSIAKSFVELQGGKFDIKVDGDLFKVIITFNKDEILSYKTARL